MTVSAPPDIGDPSGASPDILANEGGTSAAIEALKELTTSEVSDALDRLGIEGQALGISPMYPTTRIVGPAFTLSYLPKGGSDGTVGDFIEDCRPGDVVVIDNHGRLDCTVWGNILCETAKMRGLAGTVIDGICRDVDEATDIGFPVFARAGAMRTGKDRVVLDRIGAPVAIAGVRVEAGDIVVADRGGVVIVPRSRLADVFGVAQEIADRENAILDEVRSGRSLRDARNALGYHALQRRS